MEKEKLEEIKPTIVNWSKELSEFKKNEGKIVDLSQKEAARRAIYQAKKRSGNKTKFRTKTRGEFVIITRTK